MGLGAKRVRQVMASGWLGWTGDFSRSGLPGRGPTAPVGGAYPRGSRTSLVGAEPALWEQNLILWEQSLTLWEQSLILWKQNLTLWERL